MLEVGQVVDGKYRVERLLGKGGMGAVFEGYHLLVGRRVAIKVIFPEVMAAAEGIARFEREVRAAARIGSDHVLEVYDVGSLEDGSRFMVSEFLDGETLSDRIDRAPLSARETAQLTLQLLDGLGAAHEAGIVHRDLKPDNIFLLTRKGGQGDFVKIIDFGVSKYQFEDPSSMGMTTTGAVIGTPYYLSPEQARGQRDIDTRSDLYAVGVIMFQMVAGQVPIRADTFNELLFKIALDSAPPLSRDVPSIDPQFSLLVEKAMAGERAARFQTAGELRAALETWLGAGGPASLGPASLGPGSIPQRASGVAPRLSGTATVAAGMPTSSSFGRTDSHVVPRRVPKSLLFAAGIAMLAAVGWAARLIVTHAGSTPAAPSGGASITSPAAPSVPDVAPAGPIVAPAEPAIALAPTEAPPTEPSQPNQAARVPTRAGSRHALPGRPTVTPVTPVAPVTPAATSAPAPEPVTTTRKRHDFGY